MRDEVVSEAGGVPVVTLDTISGISAAHRGAIIVCGSHGGAISGAFAAQHPPALVLFNDAGIGKNGAGIVALADLDRDGIAAATVAHNSARIGDALDAWRNGTVNEANETARRRGVRVGQPVREAVKAFALMS